MTHRPSDGARERTSAVRLVGALVIASLVAGLAPPARAEDPQDCTWIDARQTCEGHTGKGLAIGTTISVSRPEAGGLRLAIGRASATTLAGTIERGL